MRLRLNTSNAGMDTIVIYRFGQLGDTIVAIPALAAVREHYPGHRVILLSETPAESHLPPSTVLEGTGLVDEFRTYPTLRSWHGGLAAFKTLRKLAREDVRALIYLVPSTRSRRQRLRDFLVFKLSGFTNLLGLHGFPTKAFPRTLEGHLQPVPSETDALLARLQHDHIAAPQHALSLALTTEEITAAQTWLAQHALETVRWFAICPGAKWPSKLWPLEYYREVGQRLITEHGLVPVVVGGKEDQTAAAELIAHWGCGHSAAGALRVRESAALFASAQFYLGNDTGAMHLAAAVGTPCIAIFSAQDWPGRWHPLPVAKAAHRVFRSHTECAGCRAVTCPHEVLCLRQVTPAEVFTACVEMIATLARLP